MKSKSSVILLIGLITIATGCSRWEKTMQRHAKSFESVDHLTTVDLRDITVQGEIGRRINMTIEKNLLALDVDNDFIKPFQEGMSEGGWEYIALGKLIDATVHFAAYTNDERVLALKRHLIDSAIANQDADGYIGLFKPGKRLSSLWDIHEMSYLILGMLRDYQYFGNEASLTCAIKMTDYMITNWENAHPWTQAKVGLDYTLLQMHKQTGNEDYLQFVINQRKLAEWNKPIKLITPSTADEDGDGIDGHHAYAYMDECRAQQELYRINPNVDLLEQGHNVLHFLTRENGLFVTGSTSSSEVWTIDQNGSGSCEESCATAYLLRLLDSQMRLDGDSLCGDIMERAIHNALFGAQATDGRELRYFTAIEGQRTYFTMDVSCCPGNFRRIMAELPSLVYYKTDEGLAINLFTQSEVAFTPGNAIDNTKSVRIRQVTDYPNSGKILIEVHPASPLTFPLSLRIPRWCESAEISINGKSVTGNVTPGTFYKIDRKWQQGDIIELNMPMTVRLVKGRMTNIIKVAVMRGPILFCLDPSRNEEFTAIAPEDLIGLNPETISRPIPDATVRPDGMAINAAIWVKDPNIGAKSVPLHLTEFPDPAGQVTYLPMQGLYFLGKYYGDPATKHIDLMCDDELFVTEPHQKAGKSDSGKDKRHNTSRKPNASSGVILQEDILHPPND